MARAYNVVDADGHILEPLDLWDNYIDPEFRERAVDEMRYAREQLGMRGGFLRPNPYHGKKMISDRCTSRLRPMVADGSDTTLTQRSHSITWSAPSQPRRRESYFPRNRSATGTATNDDVPAHRAGCAAATS